MRGGEGTVSTVPLSHDASHVVAVRLPRSSERFCTGYDFFLFEHAWRWVHY